MGPRTKTDELAADWIDSMLAKLNYKQDYSLCFGHSKPIADEAGNQTGISIRRPYIRLFETGMVKLYRIAVLGEQLPDVVLTDEQEKELEKYIEEKEKAHD